MNEAYEKGRAAAEFSRDCWERAASESGYINTKIKKVSEDDLRKALREVNKKNKEIRDSFRLTAEVMSFTCY